MKKLILLFALIQVVPANQVWVSQPISVLTSTAFFSLSNSGMTTAFLTCGNSFFQLWTVKATAKTTGLVDVCKSSNVNGVCSTAGDVTTSSAISLSIGDTVNLGFHSGSFHASEITTFTKWTGDFSMERNCVSKDFVR